MSYNDKENNESTTEEEDLFGNLENGGITMVSESMNSENLTTNEE